jgi:hypothetical protein
MANPNYNKQTTNRRGAMGGGMMKRRPGYKAGEIVGKQKNLPPFLKKKILAAKPNKKTKSKA